MNNSRFYKIAITGIVLILIITSSCEKKVSPGDWNVQWPIIDFTVSPVSPIIGDTVKFQAVEKKGSSGVVAWDWAIENSPKQLASGKTPYFVAEEEGKYHVQLIGTDANGYTGTVYKDITVTKDTGIIIKVMMFNGKPSSFNEQKYQGMADLINQYNPDLVVMREVDSSTSRSHGVNVSAYVAKKTNMYSFFGKGINYAGGGYGTAVLSRYPIIDSVSVSLAPAPGQHGSNRGCAIIAVRLNNRGKDTLVFAGAKLEAATAGDPNRLYQMGTVFSNLQRFKDYPTILGINFNSSSSGQDVFDLLESKFTIGCPSEGCPLDYPISNPIRTYDRICYEPANKFTLIKSEAIVSSAISTFRPHIVELKFVSE